MNKPTYRQVSKMMTVAVALLIPVSVSAKQVTLRVITWDTGEGFQAIQDACNEFTKRNPTIKTKLELWEEYDDKLLMSLGAGTAPDVFMIGDMNVGTYCYSGFLQPLDSFIKQDKMDLSGIIPELRNQYALNNVTYGLPKDLAPYSVFYNKDLFDAAGLQYPTAKWTWDDAVAMGKKLTKFSSTRKITQTGFEFYPGYAEPHVFLRAFGGNFMAPDKEAFDGYLNSKQTMEAIQYMCDLRNKEHILETDGEFENRKIGMQLQGPWSMATYAKMKNFNYGIVAPPIGKKRGTVILSAAWSMSASSKNKTQAWKLIKFLGGPEGNRIMARNLWALPSWNQTIKDMNIEKKPELNQLLLSTLDSVTISPIQHPFYHKVLNKYIYPLIKNTIWVSKGTAASTIPAATRICDTEYSRYLKTQPRVKRTSDKH